MVDVRVVGVRMDHWLVAMPMRVRRRIRHRRVAWCVDVLVMLVVGVRVIVFQQFVPMLVFVPLSKVQPHSDAH